METYVRAESSFVAVAGIVSIILRWTIVAVAVAVVVVAAIAAILAGAAYVTAPVSDDVLDGIVIRLEDFLNVMSEK